MYRFPKLFSHNSDRLKTGKSCSSSSNSSSSPSRQAAKSRRRLERCNASNNINYDFSPSSSPSSSSYSVEESIRTRTLDFLGDEKSFRVDGNDGEIDMLCKSLGFSGIDDFAIPSEDYKAMKERTASAPFVFSQIFEVNYENYAGINGDGGNQVCFEFPESDNGVMSKKFEESRDFFDVGRSRGHDFDSRACALLGADKSSSDLITSDNSSDRLHRFRGNGIKGVRPPVLAPTSSMLRVFTMDTNATDSRFASGFSLEGNGDEDGQNREKEANMRRVMVMEENCVLSDSYFFTTSSNDDDTSSTTTEPTSSISPDGALRRTIMGWQKGELLGSGSFGSVYEGIADDGFFFAVKEVSLLDQGDEGKQRIIQLEQEIALLSQFEHENIVRYYGTKRDESKLYIFLELVNQGSLLSLYKKYNLRDTQVSTYTRQILHGLNYLHDRNVVHRDIKCSNILVDTNGLVKLADFGLAKATKLNDLKSCKGTAFWMAPEVVRSLGYGLSADIWSLGCTVLEMLTRRFPYSHLEWMSALFRIGKGERPPIPDSLSRDARDFILKCLQVDPSSRPTATQLLDHPFVKRPLSPSSGSVSPHNLSHRGF
ncbi:Mitogen-activated protein kinase kinase kinase [Dorcoceras hygrometricum]|uniref:mitogen-activated protein kinase kinase kinase n=1 Tax=Dorcoceras hygrometricum TaxID=472368 RepID=A0A2Z7BFD0_9LAMI|nr:Mitogen-activated protein kinase kinase kinase [Dorcoceras hygrometricum]